MLIRTLYLRICAIFLGSIIAFVAVSALLWNAFGVDDYEEEVLERTLTLAAVTFPSEQAGLREQLKTARQVAETLDVSVTVHDSETNLLLATAEPATPDFQAAEVGQWYQTIESDQWITRLEDGRYLAIEFNRMSSPGDWTIMGIFLVLLAVILALITYPLLRRLTHRLENLQAEVAQIGDGYLGARVTVEGSDEIAKLATSFNAAIAKIEELLEAQQMLIANASHELRTPLARIRLGIELIERSNTELDHPATERTVSLRQDIAELNELIHELILMTRLNTNTAPMESEEIDLLALAAEECSRFDETTVEGAGADVAGDRRMIQHMVRNLVENAHKHGKAPVAVSIADWANKVELRVNDGGEGFPSKDCEKLFEPFSRGPGKQNVPGYGLGLSLVGRIADLHNAKISIGDFGPASITIHFPKPAKT